MHFGCNFNVLYLFKFKLELMIPFIRLLERYEYCLQNMYREPETYPKFQNKSHIQVHREEVVKKTAFKEYLGLKYLAVIKKTVKGVGDDMEKLEPSYTDGGIVKWCSCVGKNLAVS